MLQAARNRSGPIAPISNGLTKMPSGRPAQQPLKVRFAHREGQGAKILAAHRQHVEGAELHLGVLPAGMQRAEIGAAIDAQDHGLAVDHELACRFFSAASAIQGKRFVQS